MNKNNNAAPPIEVPYEQLNEETLKGVIDHFIEREGTDYGVTEASYQTKFRQVHQQILSGRVMIVFDPNTESITLVTQDYWQKMSMGSFKS